MTQVHREATTRAVTTNQMNSNIMKAYKIAGICLCAVALLGSCGRGKPVYSPQEQAVVDYLAKDLEGEYNFEFSAFEVIDSTTMAAEVDKRIEAFSAILRQNYNLYNNYVQAGKKRNAAKKEEAILLDTEMLKMLQLYKADNPDTIDDIAYYVYRFACEGKSEGAIYRYKEAFAAITPDNRVIGVSTDLKNLLRSTGKVIPGYTDLISGDPEEDEGEIAEE
jgi:hypothetical protein